MTGPGRALAYLFMALALLAVPASAGSRVLAGATENDTVARGIDFIPGGACRGCDPRTTRRDERP